MNAPSNDERIIAYCGLVCSECPAYLATKENNAERIAEIAGEWTELYQVNVTPESVWCDGCAYEGRKCGHCADCEVRACARNKGVDNCALCEKMASCDTIQRFLKLAPPAKEVLESIASDNQA